MDNRVYQEEARRRADLRAGGAASGKNMSVSAVYGEMQIIREQDEAAGRPARSPEELAEQARTQIEERRAQDRARLPIEERVAQGRAEVLIEERQAWARSSALIEKRVAQVRRRVAEDSKTADAAAGKNMFSSAVFAEMLSIRERDEAAGKPARRSKELAEQALTQIKEREAQRQAADQQNRTQHKEREHERTR